METYSNKTCRTCNKENFVFCDIYHEVIQKILRYVPNLINTKDVELQHITKICTNCYQMIKTIIFQIEGIMDIQKILKIESSPHRPEIVMPIKNEQNHEIIRAEDIAKKYSNIKVRKVSICSTPEKIQKIEERPKEKLVVIEALPEEKSKVLQSSPKVQRALMCISCSAKFTDFNHLQAHLKSCKTPSNHLKCFCGKILNSKKELALHVYTEHKNNKKKHICTICKKVFTSLFNLQNHVESHKGNSQLKGTFWCQSCDQKFSDMELLKKHRESSKCNGNKKMIEA